MHMYYHVVVFVLLRQWSVLILLYRRQYPSISMLPPYNTAGCNIDQYHRPRAADHQTLIKGYHNNEIINGKINRYKRATILGYVLLLQIAMVVRNQIRYNNTDTIWQVKAQPRYDAL